MIRCEMIGGYGQRFEKPDVEQKPRISHCVKIGPVQSSQQLSYNINNTSSTLKEHCSNFQNQSSEYII